ncbi:hypothetical protein HNQ64_003256 [Prosthecobacter dejongeii]|uniref:Uncharacterized protein n=1 Tax=Prosthecobacter dejongeii TaxID=48465 RepID=A0A7W8DRL1_9BACT|nr:hypothetical protein [Prosthecobacter dejongeii]
MVFGLWGFLRLGANLIRLCNEMKRGAQRVVVAV